VASNNRRSLPTYAGEGQLTFWSHTPIAPWQTLNWLEQMRRSLRPNQYLRMIQNRFVTSESSLFGDMASWDKCVDRECGPIYNDSRMPVFVGVDASTKHDSTAIVAVTFDRGAQVVRLVNHVIFQPSPNDPLDFEATIEATVIGLHKRFWLQKVIFDPYQMQASAQRLQRQGVPIEEFPQSSPNLTACSQNLYDLVRDRAIVAYPDPTIRLAMSRAIAVETSRGWRITKSTQSHKIDVVVALAMAAYIAVQSQSETPRALPFEQWVDDPPADSPMSREQEAAAYQAQRLHAYVNSFRPRPAGRSWNWS
jgi:phage terminase large subunit-like protein